MSNPIARPNISVNGIRNSIPSGYVLGRRTPGRGRTELIPLNTGAGGSGNGVGGGLTPGTNHGGVSLTNVMAVVWVLGA